MSEIVYFRIPISGYIIVEVMGDGAEDRAFVQNTGETLAEAFYAVAHVNPMIHAMGFQFSEAFVTEHVCEHEESSEVE